MANSTKNTTPTAAKCASCYCTSTIKSFKRKGLKKYSEPASPRSIKNSHARNLKVRLAAIDTIHLVDNSDFLGCQLNLLKENQEGISSILVNGGFTLY